MGFDLGILGWLLSEARNGFLRSSRISIRSSSAWTRRAKKEARKKFHLWAKVDGRLSTIIVVTSTERSKFNPYGVTPRVAVRRSFQILPLKGRFITQGLIAIHVECLGRMHRVMRFVGLPLS